MTPLETSEFLNHDLQIDKPDGNWNQDIILDILYIS